MSFLMLACSPQNTTSETMSLVPEGSVTLDHSELFQWDLYLKFNVDVQAAGFNTAELAKQHWVNNGIKDCRKAHSIFFVLEYKQNYPDLASLSNEQAVMHYLNYGKKEGQFGISTFYANPLVFDVNYYKQKNQDEVNAV